MPEELLEVPAVEAPAEEPTEPVESTEELSEPVAEEPTEPIEEPSEESASEDPAQQASPDGRKLPDDVKKALAAVKGVNPTAAGKLRDVWFQEQAYREVFATPAEAQKAKEFQEQVGDFSEFQSEREEWEALDRAYTEAPADFVKTIAESNPDAFVKVAPQAINEWAQRAPEAYGYYANQVAINTLKNLGITTDGLARIYGQLAENPQAQGIVAEIHNALLGVQQRASEFEQKRHDPREEALNQREQQFEQQRRADFEGNVATQAQTYLSGKMQPEIDRILSGRKVDPEAAARHIKLVEDKVGSMLAEIPGFEAKLESFYRMGDQKKALEYIQAQYDRVLPTAVKSEIAPLYRNINPAPKTAQATVSGAKPAPGKIVLKEMPDWKDIDFTKCSVQDVIGGDAVLRNGKQATGWA